MKKSSLTWKSKGIVQERIFLQREKILLVFSISLILLMLTFSSALTAKIGNARAVITGEVGDTIERTIKVINDNDVDVIVELFPAGELSDDIKIIDNNFTLLPGEERHARFEIYLRKAGSTENNINVRFTQVGEKQGVGISSTLIVNSVGEGELEEEKGDDGTIFTGSAITDTTSLGISVGLLWIIILILVLVAVVIIFLYLKKKSGKPKEVIPTKKKKNVSKK